MAEATSSISHLRFDESRTSSAIPNVFHNLNEEDSRGLQEHRYAYVYTNAQARAPKLQMSILTSHVFLYHVRHNMFEIS